MSKRSNWTLTGHISNHLIKPRLGDMRPPSLWPSDASALLTNQYGEEYVEGACRRHTFLRYTRDKFIYDNQVNSNYKPLVDEIYKLHKEPDRYMRWIWEAGNLFEDFVVEKAKESGVWTASQVQVVIPGWNIVGKLDLIVTNPETGGLIAQEVKSVYGYDAEKKVLGTSAARKKKELGAPKISNLLQAAIYDWHLKPRIKTLEATRLLYGDRGTGKGAEYEITTYLDPNDNQTHIQYQGVDPFFSAPVVSPITIDNVLMQYQYIQEHYETGYLPPRDFDLTYSPEQIQLMFERGELSDTQSAAHQKVLDRIEENKVLVAAGEKPKKELKPIEVAHWACSRCEFMKFCYDEDGKPRRD